MRFLLTATAWITAFSLFCLSFCWLNSEAQTNLTTDTPVVQRQLPSSFQASGMNTVESASPAYTERQLIEHRWSNSPPIPFSLDVKQEDDLLSWVNGAGILVQALLAMITTILTIRAGRSQDRTQDLSDKVEQYRADVAKSLEKAEEAREEAAELKESAQKIDKGFRRFRHGLLEALDLDIALIEDHRRHLESSLSKHADEGKELGTGEFVELLQGILSLHQSLIVLYRIFESKDAIYITNRFRDLSQKMEPPRSAVLALEACQHLLKNVKPGSEYESVREVCDAALAEAKDRCEREKKRDTE